MTFFILDPNLTLDSGHHSDWDLMIGETARRRGESVVIFAHHDCEAKELRGSQIEPWFRHTTYERSSENPYTGRFDDFRRYNDALADDLSGLKHERFKPTDCVFVPTTTEQHLLGYVSWMKSFSEATAPLFVVHLMFDCGVSATPGLPPETVDPERALFYGLAFQRAFEPGARIHFFAGGRQIARDFSQLVGRSIEPHPTVWLPLRVGAHKAGSQRVALLYAGDVKAEKGFALLPEIAEMLTRERPAWRFVIHANDRTAWNELSSALDRLPELANARSNLDLRIGRLDRAVYERMLEEVDCVVCAYDPVAYAHKSSGLLWEAIALGVPVLVPSDTWLSREVEAWGGAAVAYSRHSAEAVRQAFFDLEARHKPLQIQAQAAAKTYRAVNGPDALFDQIGALWAGRLMAARLCEGMAERNLPLDAQNGLGWYEPEIVDGETVRWTKRTFEVHFAWRFQSPWQLSIAVSNSIEAEQLFNLRAENLSGEPLQTFLQANGTSARLIVVGERPWGQDEDVAVRIVLPWTRAPKDDIRDLGIQVRRIDLGPRRRAVGGTPDEIAPVVVDTPLTWNKLGSGFHLAGVVSGMAALDPFQDASVRFRLNTLLGARVAHSVCLFVNGEPIGLRAVGDGRGSWSVSGDIARALLARGGYRAQWDLVREPGLHDDDAPIVDALRFEQSSQRVPPRAQDFAKADPGADESGAEGEQIAIGAIKIDEHIALSNGYRHLDLSLFDVVAGEDAWPHIKFKICVDRGTAYLEFREAPGWPRLFRVWPGGAEDKFGRVLRVPNLESGATPKLADESDRRTLAKLFQSLEAIVATTTAKLHASADAKAGWRVAAAALGRRGRGFVVPRTPE